MPILWSCSLCALTLPGKPGVFRTREELQRHQWWAHGLGAPPDAG